ncbi:MAG: hypothetical protein ACI9LO_000789 [Planctomycetota bacterium]|jgi:hypothetical protein
MRSFEFDITLSAQRTESLYQGKVAYLVVKSEQGLKLQLPIGNFRRYISEAGIHGRFRVEIDANNKIITLTKI